MAIRIEVLRRDAEPFARNVHDRPLLGGLRNIDVGFRAGVLRGDGGCFRCRGSCRSHESLLPGVSFALPANSPAAVLGPSEGCTRRTFMRPSAHTTVKPS